MSGALTKSLASWSREHGFGVLRVVDRHGELFDVMASPAGTPEHQRVLPWRGRSESQLRLHLQRSGRQDSEIDEALEIARAWTTTTTRVIGPLVSK